MLTSRERVRRLLNHEAVDRIPNGLGGCETAGLHLLAYDNLKRILGVEDPHNRMTTFMTTALVEPPALRAMGGDLVLLGSPKLCPAPFWGPGAEGAWKPQSFWGRSFQVPALWQFRHEADGSITWVDQGSRCPAGGIYFDIYAPSNPVEALLSDERPRPEDYNPAHDLPDELLRNLEEGARWLYENTDLAIVCGETITDLQHKPGGVQAWWMRLADEPEAAHEFLHRATEAALDQLRLLDQAVGRYVDMLQIADDIGDRRGVSIGPDLWREIYKPHYRRLFGEWHRITRMKVSLHSCGSVADILDDLIECGVDVYNPVQISAAGMDPQSLKARFGNRIIFYGGAYDAVLTPPHTPAEVVYEFVKENIRTLAVGGGYIFAGVHNIPGDTPVEHLQAILQAYRDCL